MTGSTRPVAPVAPVLFLLFVTGWAANHFAALLPVLQREEGLSPGLLAGVYGLYAVGLLPGLLLGGGLSDRIGRKVLAVPGAAVALLGTVSLLVWHDPAGLIVGRLLVGLGAGATFSAGTAWATDRRGTTGATWAGVALTAGFAGGPVVSGVLAQVSAHPLPVTFGLSALLSAVAVVGAARLRPVGTGRTATPPTVAPGASAPRRVRSTSAALGWALPIAPWVFAGATVGVVTLPSRLDESLRGPLLTGISAGVVLGTGIVVQVLARRVGAGPGAGVLGAAAAAAGLVLAGVGGAAPALALVLAAAVLLGIGYGLCLRAGLLDLATWAPPDSRGSLTGLFYLCTYIGFGVPVLLEAVRPTLGPELPLLVLGGLSVLAAFQRGLRLARSRG
ncbi:MFS transporter [Nakamurella flava]|uniref:MFS transporter n=1 Tax=Nakamurella flava TaxID=2576308 RepID=A0A4U6QGC7_9ACTN|nr:MFS transporter [Nakamurella flava]TKV59201.1 MFS transporter [Nakamurella flava]